MKSYNQFSQRVILDSPVVETTPVVWKNRLLLLEHWQREWEHPAQPEGLCFNRIRDVESDTLVVPQLLDQFVFPSAIIWNEIFYIFTAKKGVDAKGRNVPENIYVIQSADLKNWTKPIAVITPDPGELLFNETVCYNGKRFVMAYETNNPMRFTIKFAYSDDLVNWIKIPNIFYDGKRPVGCPAIRHVGNYYYMLYSTHLYPRWWFDTRLARSKDLQQWEESPFNPIIEPDPTIPLHPDCPKHGGGRKTDPSREEGYYNDLHPKSHIRVLNTAECTANGHECNVADPDLVEWKGKTRIYFSGGCQHWGGLLQYVEYDGSMKDFFESCYT